MALDIKQKDNTIVFPVKIVPGSSRDKIAGLLGDALKITIAAAPEKGKANKALIKYLAKTLNIAKTSISIISGQHDTHKVLEINNLTIEQFKTTLNEYL